MGVALVSWGRFQDAHGNKITVPAPPTNPDKPWLLDFLASDVKRLAATGFTAIQLPPTGKAQGGDYAGCDGYGVFDPRDLGSKPQQGSTNTRYGSKQSLLDLVGVCHANGMDVYLDLVLHQRIGGRSGIYKYLGADKKTLNGRGAMHPGCFRGSPVPPFRPEDPVPVPADDFAFGDELVYKNCDPPNYTINDALDYGDWLFRTTGADGARFDDTKGTWVDFVAQFMNTATMARKFFCSEYFDGNPSNLDWWARQPPMSGRSHVADFTLHWAIQGACDGGNVRALNGAGYVARQPNLACTFVDNPDTDSSPGQQVINNKLLAYVFLLTIEGYPYVYGKDYYGPDVWPGAYGLHKYIDNLVWIHEQFANGKTITRHLDDKCIVLNRIGNPGLGLLTGINFDTWNVKHITCATSFGPNFHLHDYSGHCPDIITDANGNATFTIPSNAYSSGQSYCCFAPVGYNNPIKLYPRATKQTFFGSFDLDIPQVRNAKPVVLGTVLCDANSELILWLKPNTANWNASTIMTVSLVSSNNLVVAEKLTATLNDITPSIRFKIAAAQRYELVAVGSGLPDDGSENSAGAGSPFELTVQYTAPNIRF